MITKKEILMRLIAIEDAMDICEDKIKSVERKVKKLEKPSEGSKKTTKKAK